MTEIASDPTAGADAPAAAAPEPRPRTLMLEHRHEVALKLAGELAEAKLIGSRDIDEYAYDLAGLNLGRWADGYAVMKALENGHDREGSFAAAEILDGYSSSYGAALDRQQALWAERNNIQPPLPIGASVVLRGHRGREAGVITGIYEYGPAQYLVRIEGGPENSRRVVNFEDVQPASGNATPTADCRLPTAAVEAR